MKYLTLLHVEGAGLIGAADAPSSGHGRQPRHHLVDADILGDVLQTNNEASDHGLEERTSVTVCACRRVRPADGVRGLNADAGRVDGLAAALSRQREQTGALSPDADTQRARRFLLQADGGHPARDYSYGEILLAVTARQTGT